jgi:hypothetical protein
MTFKVRIQSSVNQTPTGNYREASLLYKEAISDLKGQLATFPCRKLAVLFGNMSECYMQLDDIEQ